jgi:hypothetical protein
MKNQLLVIPSLFTITAATRHSDITRDMQSDTESIHAIEMFNRCSIVFEITFAIHATMTKGSKHRFEIIGTGYTASTYFTGAPTYFV